MSNEMIFQDNRCLGDRCRLNGDEKLQLEKLAEQHPGNVAVGVCFERSRLRGCGLQVLGQFTPENAQELKAVITDNGDNLTDTDNT